MTKERAVITAQEMVRLEKRSISQGANEEAYMDAAARGLASLISQRVTTDHPLIFLIGKGNKGGDGLALAALMREKGYTLHIFTLSDRAECSPLCQKKWRAFEEIGGKISPLSELQLPMGSVIIDALLGTGFHGSLDPSLCALIEKVNASHLPIYSIDLPSGLNGTSGEVASVAIEATETWTVGAYKSGFFYNDGYNYVGQIHPIDIGLSLEGAEIIAEIVDTEKLKSYLPKIKRKRHKYQSGSVLTYAGSEGMTGSAFLSVKAAYRSGAGIVKLYHDRSLSLTFANPPLELVRIMDWDIFINELERTKAIIVGPGIGYTDEAKKRFADLFDKAPQVIDADALAFLVGRDYRVKQPTVLTPHRAELLRLFDREALKDEELVPMCQEYVEKTGVTLLYKGAPTWIFSPGEKPQISMRGDPGMATAGSGDVLTGIIAAMLSQGVSAHRAALLGVYLHSVAGEISAKRLTSYCTIASDFINAIPLAFHTLL